MSTTKPRVVIIGANFAGLSAAAQLSRQYAVTVVDARQDFEWTPNIHEILSGVKARSGVVLSRADSVSRYGHRFVLDRVTQVNSQTNTVVTAGGLNLPYEACLIAAGSQTTTFGVPGADRYSLPLRLVSDAVAIGERLDQLANRKRRASVVIVGGGVSGVEALGEIFRRRGRGDEFNIHVVEQAERLFPQQPAALAKDLVKRCAPFPVQWHTNSRVTQINARSVLLENGDKITADLCIWSAGMALPDFLRSSELNECDGQWLPVDAALNSYFADNIFVAGDCAGLPEALGKQAFHAIDMGELAGRNISRFLNDEPLQPFRPSKTPLLIAFGDITTWLVAGSHIVASPVLAAAKEGVYQANMARFASPYSPLDYAQGLACRAIAATRQLLLPQLNVNSLLNGLKGSRIVG